MEAVIRTLGATEGGKRFLINLHAGLASGHIAAAAARKLMKQAERVAPDPISHWHPYGTALRTALFDRPDQFQFKGRTPKLLSARWMTVKSGDDLARLILQSPWIDSHLLRSRFRVFPMTDGSGVSLPTETQARTFARLINDQDEPVRFRLALAFRRPGRRVPGHARPVPAWFSRWCLFSRLHPGLLAPSEDLAGRLRDWLGLSQFGVGTHMFAICARVPTVPEARYAFRPTVFEGIDNAIFKHRTTPDNDRDRYGATADIELLRQAPRGHGDNIDGSPEIVLRRAWFHPRRFECVYLGRAPDLLYDPHGDFHSRLLGGAALAPILDDLVLRLTAA